MFSHTHTHTHTEFCSQNAEPGLLVLDPSGCGCHSLDRLRQQVNCRWKVKHKLAEVDFIFTLILTHSYFFCVNLNGTSNVCHPFMAASFNSLQLRYTDVYRCMLTSTFMQYFGALMCLKIKSAAE